jgi:hypothetical protein
MADQKPLKVNEQSPEVAAMSVDWPIIDALMGGTRAMRAAGQLLLPKWPKEEQNSYDSRLHTATLYPAFKRTISVMTGKPFSKELTLSEDTPDILRKDCENINLEGQNLHSFASELFAKCMSYGIAGVLVDTPRNPVVAAGGRTTTQAEETALGIRPYCICVPARRVLGWHAERVQGVLQMTQLRLWDARIASDGGPYGQIVVPQVRVLTPGAWALWEMDQATKDFTVPAGNGTTSINMIPYIPFYGFRTDYAQGRSPLEDLAFLNVKHWQSQSDQDTIMHVARVPIMTVTGIDTGEDSKFELNFGASAVVTLPMGSTMDYVEHTGAAIAAGVTALLALEQQMVQTGAELLVVKPGVKTATEANNDAEGNKSDLQRIVEGFEDSLDQVLGMMALWRKLPVSGKVTLFKDFGAANLSDASAQLVVSLQQGGLITKETALKEQMRRGMLSPDLDVQKELADVKLEAPALGLMGEGTPPKPPGGGAA